MDARKFEKLKAKISNNQLRCLKFREGTLTSVQFFDLLPNIKINTSIIKLRLISRDMSHELLGNILGAFINSTTLAKLKILTQGMTPFAANPLRIFLEKNKSLTKLDLSNCNLDDDVIVRIAPAFSVNSSLQKLNLTRNRISVYSSSALFGALSANITLKELILADNHLHSEALSDVALMLEANKSLTCIDLRSNGIRNAELKALAEAYIKNTSLIAIKLADNRIGDEGMQTLAQIFTATNRFQTVYVSANWFTKNGLRDLIDGLRKTSSLVSFGCANNFVGDEGGLAIADLVHSSKSLKSLYAYGCGLNAFSAAAISIALQVHHSITELDLCGAQFNYCAAYHLAHALQSCTGLVSLNLSECNLDDNSLQVIMNVLILSLKKLNLASNQFGIMGFVSIMDYLAFNKVLTSLDLSANHLTAECCILLANELTNNDHLRKLILNENPIGDKGISALLNALRTNFCLRSLSLKDIPNTVSIEAILDFFRSNHSIYKFVITSVEITKNIRPLLGINHKILKWLGNYLQDMFIVNQNVLTLIQSKGIESAALVPLDFEGDIFLRCVRMALVRNQIAVENLNALMSSSVFADCYLSLFYAAIKDLFTAPRNVARPLYRLGIFTPPSMEAIEGTVPTPENEPPIFKLSLNY